MRILTILAIAGLVVAPASADVLWDQSAFDPSVNAIVDQEFPDFPTYSSYMVMDVLTAPTGWEVQSVETLFTNAGGVWEGITSGRLNIFPKTGALPTAAQDPSAGMAVPVTVTNMGDHYLVDASGLSINLDPSSEYWVGLTPIAEFGLFGQEFHSAAAPLLGDDTAWRNPGGSFGFGTGWQTVALIDSTGQWVGQRDAAFRVEGVPEPSALALLGIGALALIRRR